MRGQLLYGETIFNATREHNVSECLRRTDGRLDMLDARKLRAVPLTSALSGGNVLRASGLVRVRVWHYRSTTMKYEATPPTAARSKGRLHSESAK